MSFSNYQIIKAKIRDKKKIILKQNPDIDEGTGIYIIYRYDYQKNEKICYIGQAKNMLERLARHLFGYQAIDNSIRKHRIYDKEKNPSGYKFRILCHCDESILDEQERYCIGIYMADGWILKNITGGGQNSKESDINERKQSKGYMDGLKQGYNNCLKDVRVYFEKYLDFVIKEPRLTKTKKPIVIKQKKYEEFDRLLKGENNDEME